MIRTQLLFGLGTGALLLAPAPAFAQAPPAYDGTAVIDAIEDATLMEALAAIGAEAAPLGEDEDTYRIEYPQGGRAILRRVACEAGPCKGLLMLGYYTLPEGRTREATDQTAREFSLNYNPAAIIINDNGEHIVKSYLIFDGGITKGNLAVRLALFGDAVRRYGEVLYGDGDEDGDDDGDGE